MNKPKAIPYQRFSSLNQGKGSTLYRQQKMIDKWLSEHPEVELSHIAPVDKGKSAFKGKNLEHGFGLILNAIELGEVKAGDYILVEAIDRISRLEPMRMMSLLENILSSGVIIVTLGSPSVEYTQENLNSGTGELFLLVGKVIQAHEYSKTLSKRVSEAYERKRQDARNGKSINMYTPIWLTSYGKLIPEKAKAVQEMISLYLEGRGTKWIIESLSIKYPFLRSVHPTTPKRWFTNRAIIGEWYNKGEIIPNVFEPLIDIETFKKLQEQVKRNYKQMSAKTTYSLAGLVLCKKCGKRYHIRRKENVKNTIVYMNCSTYLKRGKSFCDNNMSLPYEFVEFIFNKTYEPFLIEICNKNAQETSNKEALEVQHEINNLEEQMSNLEEVYSKTRSPSALEKIMKLNEEISKLQEKYISITSDQRESSDNYSSHVEIEGFEDCGSDIEHLFFSNNEAKIKFNELSESTFLLNNALLKSSYRITANLNKVEVIESDTQHTLTLYKRSQYHNCYLAEYIVKHGETIDVTTGETTIPPIEAYKVALNRDGFKYEDASNSWEEFNKNIIAYKTES